MHHPDVGGQHVEAAGVADLRRALEVELSLRRLHS
jgi:hypothetical protein